MGKVYFLFGVHNHQPVGNFHHVFRDALKGCYRPFIETLKNYPSIKCNLHTTGPLYDWILEHAPSFFKTMQSMAARGQLEIISGGYYEPVLPLISDEDKFSQIALMNDFIRKQFKQAPQGIWVAERVWEPYLAGIINDAGLRYTFLDDTHFRYAGISQKDFFGYYTTEDAAKPLFVFPISKLLRYKIPFSKAHEAVDLLQSFAQNDDVLVTLFDDGEKFGLWPHTYEWVYEKGWLKEFFRILTERKSAVETILAHDAIKKFSSKGLVYLPTASYEEMSEWVLEPAAHRRLHELKEQCAAMGKSDIAADFLRGGFFRNFYQKYPRLNFMHKKMQYVSGYIRRQKSTKSVLERALNFLWKGQCNCGYWHGIFGGFYLGHIRASIYEYLIRAQAALDDKVKGSDISLERLDLDLDGIDETVVQNKHLIATLSDRGATLVELSFKNTACNYLNTITRQEESYHSKVKEKVKKNTKEVATIHEASFAKEDDLDKFLIYDTYEKAALCDHIVEKNITLEDFTRAKKMTTLANEMYEYQGKKKKTSLELNYLYRAPSCAFTKRITLDAKARINTQYQFSNTQALGKGYFAVEYNIFLQSPQAIEFVSDQKRVKGSMNAEFRKVTTLVIEDSFKSTHISFTCNEADIFIVPVYSVSSSEAGLEKAYQQMSILFINKYNVGSFTISCLLKEVA